jgi:hypothetical protein
MATSRITASPTRSRCQRASRGAMAVDRTKPAHIAVDVRSSLLRNPIGTRL